MDIDDIAVRQPINSTASRVTSQPRKPTDKEQANHDRDALVARMLNIDGIRKNMDRDSSEYKTLGAEKQSLQNRIRKLNVRLARYSSQEGRNLSAYIADVCKERLPPGQWKIIVDEANRRFVEHNEKE